MKNMVMLSDPKPDRFVLIYEGKWITGVPEVLVIKAGAVLSSGAFRLWVVLMYFAGHRGEIEKACFQGVRTLASAMGITPRNLQHYQKELVQIKLLRVDRKARKIGWGVTNHYTMLDPDLWWRQTGRTLRKTEETNSHKKTSVKRFLQKQGVTIDETKQKVSFPLLTGTSLDWY